MKGSEIGKMFRIDYSRVSVCRNRLRNKIKKDKELSVLAKKRETKLSSIKI